MFLVYEMSNDNNKDDSMGICSNNNVVTETLPLQRQLSSSSSNEPDTLRVFLVALLILASLFVGVTLLGVLIYVCFWIQDHWCCCCCCFRPTILSHDSNSNDPTTSVAEKARLTALSKQERRILLDYIFREKITYQEENDITMETKSSEPNKDTQAATAQQQQQQQQPITDDICQTNNKTLDLDKDQSIANETKDTGNNSTLQSTQQEQIMEQTSQELNGSDHQDTKRTCGICLAAYRVDDALLRGKQCGHVFHWTCSMEWMSSSVLHDHCPYCRQELFTAVEYRHAALDILGPQRVSVLGNRLSNNEPPSDDDDDESSRPDETTTTATATQTETVPNQTIAQRDTEEIPDWDW